MDPKDKGKDPEKAKVASEAAPDQNAAGDTNEDGSELLALDESIGAWNEDEEEGTIETSDADASEGERGYRAGQRGGASGAPPAENPDERARRSGGPRDDRKR
jgi:hypothetical protein